MARSVRSASLPFSRSDPTCTGLPVDTRRPDRPDVAESYEPERGPLCTAPARRQPLAHGVFVAWNDRRHLGAVTEVVVEAKVPVLGFDRGQCVLELAIRAVEALDETQPSWRSPNDHHFEIRPPAAKYERC